MCNLARMAMHPARLNSLNNEDVIKAFTEAQPCRLHFQRICQDNNNNFNESEGSICSSFFTFILLLTMYIAQSVSIFLSKIQYLCKLYNSILITSMRIVCSSVHIKQVKKTNNILPQSEIWYDYVMYKIVNNYSFLLFFIHL